MSEVIRKDDTVYKILQAPDFPLGREAGRKGCLLMISGSGIGQVFDLAKSVSVFGRGREVDFQLTAPSISRTHFMIERKSGEYIISDQQSFNGTYVNRKRIERPTVLKEGDKIFAGELKLRFSLLDAADDSYHTQIRSMAVKDGLTGVFNKAYFLDFLQNEFQFSQRHHSPISLIFMDIDHFKTLNDTMGHDAGDQVLRELSKLVRDMERNYDLLARYGGEEFVVLLRGVTLDQTVAVAERIRAMIENYCFIYQGKILKTTVSMGVSIYKGGEEYNRPGEFVQAADARLYRAKLTGRNQVCY